MHNKMSLALLVATTAILPMSILAAEPGFYVEGHLGYANTHVKTALKGVGILDYFRMGTFEPIINYVPVNGLDEFGKTLSNDFAGHMVVGYQFNPFVAVELGYLRVLTKTKAKHYVTTLPQNITGYSDLSAPINTQSTLAPTQVFGAAIKGLWPVGTHLNFYGKLGIAYLNTKNKFSLITPPDSPKWYRVEDRNQCLFQGPLIAERVWAPTVAVGLSYELIHNLPISFAWTHIQPLGPSSDKRMIIAQFTSIADPKTGDITSNPIQRLPTKPHKPGNLDFFSIGIGYHFG